MDFAPVWLPIFCLCNIITYLLGALMNLPWKLEPVEGDQSSCFTQLFWLIYGSPLLYFFSAIPITYFCFLKLESHKTMLDQMASFDLRMARCSLETDRIMIRRQVLGFFDEALRPPLSVSVDELLSAHAKQTFNQEQELEHSEHEYPTEPNPSEEEDWLLAWGHSGFRHVTSYPSQEEIIDEFNAYVRGPLRENVVRSFGREDHIPFKVCLVSCLPCFGTGLALILGCDGHRDCQLAALSLGFNSVIRYQVTNAMLVLTCFSMLLKPADSILQRGSRSGCKHVSMLF